MSELLERILSAENVKKAQKRVYQNKGASGVDGVTVEELEQYMDEHWGDIRQQIRERKYRPQPALRVEIPKESGGVRKLGIPVVVDRTIQQAIVQILSPIFETRFSEYSYGFRPGRSCEQAIRKALEYLNDGYEWIVDIDLEKFFDNVPQDKLMTLVNKVIQDGDTESLIRKYLQAGVMNKGVYEETELGTPQGGNLSPLLSNIMLTELDRELEKRGLRFTRYADDCVILVGSEASAKRVMYSITRYIERKLGLKVNATKTHITRPMDLKYLGFSFWKKDGAWRARPHKKSVAKLKAKLKELCKRSWSVSMDYRLTKLNQTIQGWVNYFAIGDMKTVMTEVDGHLRRMLIIVIWKQWKTPAKRRWGLTKLGINKWQAKLISGVGDKYMKVSKLAPVKKAISKQILARRGLCSPLNYYLEKHALKLI